MDLNDLLPGPIKELEQINDRIKAIEQSLISIDNSLKQLAPVIALLKRLRIL